MLIDDYLDREGLTAAEFAVRIGLSAASLSRIRLGKQMPGRETLEKIFELTGGAVSPNDVLSIGAPPSCDAKQLGDGCTVDATPSSGKRGEVSRVAGAVRA